MLATYVNILSSHLAQLENSLGVPIPSVTDAREALNVALAASDPVEFEKRMAETEVALNAISGGAQPAPNSILASLITRVEQHRQMKQHIAAGMQVGWAREQISIDGVVHQVMVGAWPVTDAVPDEEPAEPPKRASRPRRAKQ